MFTRFASKFRLALALVPLLLVSPFSRAASFAKPRRGARTLRSDRGDVPGWVLITMMSAGLVVVLWTLAGDALTDMFSDSMNSVRAKQ
ncbi:hypothetical protein [Brevibacterium samyangense]|uniref:Uncharacterized protein n=1 Tax=Brevibacterium samyangense TaxID=366888 RepID=A0ABP5EPC6_9MICO